MKKYITEGLEPRRVLELFEEISAIPRGSGDEEAVAKMIEKFASDRGCYCLRDGRNNVFVRVPATAGREHEGAILLQGHTDMVCEKNSGVEHDFMCDGLELYVEDGWLRARGTTLGGDDGAAVAMMLAVIDGCVATHPTVECLFTTDEEVGLLGAGSFDYSVITSKKMINLDSEEENAVTAGCAGGVRSDLVVPVKMQEARGEALDISLTGLCGGHSGENINCGRANAIKLLGRILVALSKKMRVNIVSVNGGGKDNAIPREAFCTVSVAKADRAARAVLREVERIRGELCADDAGLTVGCAVTAESPAEMMNAETTRRVLAVMACVQNGVIEMSRDIPGLVGFSRNLGIVKTDDAGVTFVFSSRSPVESQLDASVDSLDALAAVTGAATRHYSRYPGWDFASRSPLRTKYLKVARGVLGYEPKVNVIHAGLECGIIRSHLPKLDMISVGPDMKGIHSPDEALSIESLGRLWRILEEMLK